MAALFQDSTADAIAAVPIFTSASSSGGVFMLSIDYQMTAGTTSATTFKLRAGPQSGSILYVNGNSGSRLLGGVCTSGMKITEYSP
jgi:hypothetical protein